MDISDYETNIISINGIKSIAFQVYEPTTDQAHSLSSIIFDTDDSLRDAGRIFYFDTVRRALWHFYLASNDGPSVEPGQADGLGPEVAIAGSTLALVEHGSFEPLNLFKGRVPAPGTAGTPTGTAANASTTPDQSQRVITGPNPPDADKIISVSTMSNRSSSTTVKDAYERFITALLSTTSMAFCRRMGAVPLNPSTVLLDPKTTRHPALKGAGVGGAALLGTFRTYLTTTGSLVIGLSLSFSEGIIPLTEAHGSGQPAFATQVLAAPFGVLGTYQGLATGALPDALGQTPDTRVWRPRQGADSRSSQWRDMCTSILRGRGVPSEILEDCTWIALQLPRRSLGDPNATGLATPVSNTSTIISWPAVLCFRRRALDPQGGSDAEGRHGFSEETADVLSVVQQWFQAAPDREESMSLRRKGREAAASREAAAAATAAANNAPPMAQSPVDPRRAGNTNAAGAVYPTPPDGIQNPLAATPAAVVDGALSSPTAPPSIVAPVDMDISMGNTTAPSEAEHWEQPTAKRDRGESFDGDNLFGDMGPDMFGGEDITDADFSFFDEEPEEGDMALSDIRALPVQEPTAAPEPAPIKPPPPKPPTRESSKEKMPPPSSPAFVKPEPRHARTTVAEEVKPQSAASKPSAGVKRDSSPFDPDTVFKKVRASLSQPRAADGSAANGRKGSVYDGIEFDPGLPLANKKYEAGGRFDCTYFTPQPEPNRMPTTDYLKRHGKQNRKNSKVLDPTSALIRSFNGTLGPNTFQGSPDKADEVQSDADDISMDSDLDDTPEPTEDPASPMKGSSKRFNLDDDVASHVTSLRDAESVVEDSDPSLALELPRIARVEAPSMSVTRYFDTPEPASIDLVLSDEETITVAQILTEQVVSGNICIHGARQGLNGTLQSPETRRHLSVLARALSTDLRESLPAALTPLSPCSMKKVVEVADIPLFGPSSRFVPRPVPSRDPNAEPPKPSNLYSIPVPHLELKRMETKLSVLPSSVQFWETMGFGPSPGPKEVTAVCVFPGAEGLDELAASFLEQMRHTYEFLKLGPFDLLNSESHAITGGLVPWDASVSMTPLSADGPFNSPALHERMKDLNEGILAAGTTKKNFVVFFAYSPSYPESIVETCAAFQQLFEMQKKSLADKKKQPANELVLQLVPTNALTSILGTASTDPEETIRMALETYDRCTLFGGPMPAPAIVLEQTLPRSIDFRLNNSGSSSLMHENTCIHIAYAQSVDDRWITAAWTDNRGSQQMTASYNLGRKGKPLSSPLNEIMHEIWETTHDLISRWKVHWRVIITKSGHMDQKEIDFWIALGETESVATISLTLISVDTNPSLQLLPPSVRVPPGTSGSFYTTPVSTPQPSTMSPDQIGTPATPMKDVIPTGAPTPGSMDGTNEPADGDAILVDVTDQTWGAILSHRLGTSSSPGDLGSALVSGYLVKRGGVNAEDPPVVMEVNILRNDGNPRAHDTLMREMLSYFRGLGTLARARAMVDRETDIRPWHVAAAEKGVQALYLLM
ncbi:mediator complex subunit 13 C-terminal-domain-containing protein [Plectosphaerella cucumerina]|uniref:Mediator of RNA polymerase II transcription subunit 13 n=1 Tax=Plectosphaerella cucumerina TaxID=40658 RepID=A0A8K0TI44_9PEZI|nr:mediator complex subunit 13 C-terminal-domain-containing protein [Plectosphaerella cucumerina]